MCAGGRGDTHSYRNRGAELGNDPGGRGHARRSGSSGRKNASDSDTQRPAISLEAAVGHYCQVLTPVTAVVLVVSATTSKNTLAPLDRSSSPSTHCCPVCTGVYGCVDGGELLCVTLPIVWEPLDL